MDEVHRMVDGLKKRLDGMASSTFDTSWELTNRNYYSVITVSGFPATFAELTGPDYPESPRLSLGGSFTDKVQRLISCTGCASTSGA